MKISFLVLTLLFSFTLFAQQKVNVSLFGQFHRGDIKYSGSWSYTDFNARKEYAVLGTRIGVAVYDIDNQPIIELGFIAGPPSNWREITVLGHHAYVTTEGSGDGEGMQVIDLSPLPNPPILVTTYSETFTRGHIIQSDITSEAPYVYVMGVCSNCGVNILDVSDPINPKEISTYTPGYYIHDAHIRGDYMYAAAFSKGVVDIVDISDKLNPTLVAQIDDPGGNTHSTWLTEDSRHLIISDEKDGLPARIWNIEDFSNTFEVATYSGNLQSLTHNPYVRGDFAFFSHNTEGLRVVDVQDAALPVEVGYYDTFDGLSGGFHGLWSACPFYPSGKIIGGNREDGLYVWTFNNTRARRFYAKVKDAQTNERIENVTFFIQKKDIILTPDFQGVFRYGSLADNFKVEISAEGYEGKGIEIKLEPGDSLVFDILLEQTSVGLFDINKDLPALKIAPNPFSEFTVIDLAGFENADYLQVFDVFGRLLRTEKVVGNSNFIFERRALQQGVYIFSLVDDAGELIGNRKVVIGD